MTEYRYVAIDSTKCIGCGICELICSFEKTEKKSFNPQRSRIKVLQLHPTVNIAMTCRLCESAPCVPACPRKALVQSEENGAIIVDATKCTGCGWCLEVCDFGSIEIDEKKTAVICDLCKGRRGIGVFPGRKIAAQACIEWCPEEALQLVTRNRRAQRAREEAAVSMLKKREET